MSHTVADLIGRGGAIVGKYVEVAKAHSDGGPPYFEELDRLLRYDPYLFSILRDLVIAAHGEKVDVVVSGRFGDMYDRWCRSMKYRRPLVVRGGLRYEPSLHYGPRLDDYRRKMVGSHFDWVFVDDTLYRGRSMDWVRDLVLMSGRRFVGAVVAYDGSKEVRFNVTSLYRYYPNEPSNF